MTMGRAPWLPDEFVQAMHYVRIMREEMRPRKKVEPPKKYRPVERPRG